MWRLYASIKIPISIQIMACPMFAIIPGIHVISLPTFFTVKSTDHYLTTAKHNKMGTVKKTIEMSRVKPLSKPMFLYCQLDRWETSVKFESKYNNQFSQTQKKILSASCWPECLGLCWRNYLRVFRSSWAYFYTAMIRRGCRSSLVKVVSLRYW